MSLVGKFFHVVEGDRYGEGQVIGEMRDGDVVEIKYDIDDCPARPTELVSVDDLCAQGMDDTKWFFFESREELRAWIAWLETDDGPKIKVVNLREKKP